MTRDDASSAPWAVSLTVPEELLNELAAAGIGDGITVAEFRNVFQLPMMGPLELAVNMSIVEVSFTMLADHDGALLGRVRATGSVEVVGDSPMPVLPGLARVRGDVLVRPVIELRDDGSFVAVLDLLNSELVDMVLEGIDGLEADMDAQAQLSQMLFAAVGGELFTGLAQNLGNLGVDLGPDEGAMVAGIGVATGPAVVEVRDGCMVVGLPATPGLAGHAEPAAASGCRLGVGLSSASLEVLTLLAASLQLPGALPLEIDLHTTSRRVGARVRSTRLVDHPLVPDLRSAIRTTLRPRLVGDTIEISLREAWVELPPIVPEVVNRFNRFLGGAASRVSLSVKLPATVTVPVRPESDRTVDLTVSSLDVSEDGVTACIAAAF